ncbi:hypothetical protein P12x_002528 [Tundrisphaera lichenicola]|uniref:hypothetical protein n=1 Tax=Tundrisphaera lichenicola TaxID=2029860 RepID=UPI003EBCF87F
MSTQPDESTRLRIRDAAMVAGAGRLDRPPSFGAPCLLAQTKKIATYPTAAGSFFACSPLTLMGLEVEGGPGSISVGPSTFFALNLGSAVPPVGANVLATFVDSRWVFRFDG